MKNFLFAIVLTLPCMLSAQIPNYTLDFSNGPYIPLEYDTVAVETGWAFAFSNNFNVDLDFDFEIFGNPCTRFEGWLGLPIIFKCQEGLPLPNGDTTEIWISPYIPQLENLGVETSDVLSHILLQQDGEPGSRILKLEYANAGIFHDVWDSDDPTSAIMNIQLWFYEGSICIEYRFGPNDVPNPEVAYPGYEGPVFGVYALDGSDLSDEVQMAYYYLGISGHPVKPIFQFEEDFDFIGESFLTEEPEDGAIYTFCPGEIIATETIPENTISISPNPVLDFLSVEMESFSNRLQYEIINVMGQTQSKGNLYNASSIIEVSQLSKGAYFIQIHNNSSNTTFKFIKQ